MVVQKIVETPFMVTSIEETRMSNLDSPAKLGRCRPEKCIENIESVRPKGRRKLNRDRLHQFMERFHTGQKRPHLILYSAKSSVMGDRPGQLEHEPEVGGYSLGPTSSGVTLRCCVERCVPLDRIHHVCICVQL